MLSLLALSLPLIALSAAQDAAIVRTGDHFRVHCHVNNQALADEALLAVESVWDVAHELYAFTPREGEALLDVHLYRTVEQYEAAEQELTQGAFKSNLTFSHIASKSSHVTLQPFLSDQTLEQTGLPLLTRSFLAHEAAHLVSFLHWPDPQRAPDWLGEGAASYVEELTLNSFGIEQTPEQLPYFSTKMGQIQGLLESKSLPSSKAIMGDDLAGLISRERYAVQWIFVRFLASTKHKKSLAKIFDACRMTGGGPGFAERFGERVEGILGQSKQKALDKGFRDYIKKLKPLWKETYRSLEPRDKSWLQGTLSNNAIAWFHTEAKKKYTIKGSLLIFDGDGHQMNVLLGRGDAGFIQVCFVAGDCVTLLEYDSAKESWKKQGYAKADKLSIGQAFQFSINVKGNRIEVAVEGTSLLSVDIPDRPLAGQWGLGALRGSSGLWKIKAAPGY